MWKKIVDFVRNENSGNPQNPKQESDSESDVEEIGQEDFHSTKDTTSPKINSPFKNQNPQDMNNFSPKNIPPSSYNPPQFTSYNQNQYLPPQEDIGFLSFDPKNLPQSKLPTNIPIKRQQSPKNPQNQNSPIRPNPPIQNYPSQDNSIPYQVHPSVTIPKFFTFSYHGISVKFPYEKPYEAQKMLISSTILAFKNGQNALLESPTGTGKSLALLSASLAYLETNPAITKLYYTSRTHIQLQQLVGEFKKLPYFPSFSILASRRHLCIVPEVASSSSPDYDCRRLCDSEEGCPFNNVNGNNNNNNKSGGDLEDLRMISGAGNNPIPFEFTNRGDKPKFDLEDLKIYGRNHKVCPYQLAFAIYHGAQVAFCPYNYILKANDDKNLLLDFGKNTTIAIFDEGHNIEGTAREDASLSLTYKQVFDARNAAQYVPHNDSYKALYEQVQRIQTDIINFLERKRRDYDQHFQNNNNNNNINNNNRPKFLSGESFRSVFPTINETLIAGVGIQMYTWLKLLANSDKNDHSMYKNDILISFFSACCDVFGVLNPQTFDFFRIVFVPDEKGDINRDEFRLLCLKPSFLFEKINRKARSIIITSGTLSPLDSFAAELESSFPIRVSAPHVVDSSQVLTISINKHRNVRITSRYSSLQSQGQEIYSALSQIVYKTIKTVPGGSLLFTPSYYTKDAIIREWKSSNMFDRICEIKQIVEEKSNLSAPQIIREFVSCPNGGLLIGVCRGKISEGLDFSDDLSRIVYVFGIPYPGFKEADVELKMKYNDIRKSTNKNYLSGQEWYTCQAFRALFQSVGRCLRHTSDYGAIVFLDERIEANIEKLPTWLKMNLHISQSAEQAEVLLSSFYKENRTKFPGNNLAASPLLSQQRFSQKFSGFQLPKDDQFNDDFQFANKSQTSKIPSYQKLKNSIDDPFKKSPVKTTDFSSFNYGNCSYENQSKYGFDFSFNMNNNTSQKKPDQNYSSSLKTGNYDNPFGMNNYPMGNNAAEKKPAPNYNNPFGMNNYSTERKPTQKYDNSFNMNNYQMNNNATEEKPAQNYNNPFSMNNYSNEKKPAQTYDSSFNMNSYSTEKKPVQTHDNSFNMSNNSQEKKPAQTYDSSSKASNSITSNDPGSFQNTENSSENPPTSMFCSSCGSLVIRISNLDEADFKSISTPEFFQILNLNGNEAKIMFLTEKAIQTDLTKSTRIIRSEAGLCIFVRRQCPKCGTPLAAYVASVDANSQFKKGEILFRKEMLSVDFEGKLMNLVDIA